MTKREKISILKKALDRLIRDHKRGEFNNGICNMLVWASQLWASASEFGINLPRAKYGPERAYCWPLTAKGAAIRRRVMKNAIKRLEK